MAHGMLFVSQRGFRPMPVSPTDAPANHGGLLTLQAHRLQQIVWATAAAVGVALMTNALHANYLQVFMLTVALLVTGYAYHANQRGQLALATRVLLFTILVLLGGMVFVGRGLFDGAVYAFPALLVFASMFGSRRLFVSLAVLMVAILGSVYALERSQILVYSATTNLGAHTVNLMAILSVTAFLVWLLASDLRDALRRLESDKHSILESHARIEILAHRDTLTNLPNRALARDRLKLMVSLAKRNNAMAAVLFLDLDNFKSVNDSLGHLAGDQLLCQVADRLHAVLRDSDTVSRQGGDEFLLVIGDVVDESSIAAAANKVIQQLAQPFILSGIEIMVTASVGVAVYPRDGVDCDTLLKCADLAMYRAKDAGRNAFRFFDPEMNQNVVEHLHLASGLRAAMGNGELQVYFQPQLELSTGKVVGAEALLRWKHPELGFIPPNKFIPVAERSGLINDVGSWVMDAACRQAQQWRQRGLGDLVVAINVSPLQFRRDDVERGVANALEKYQLPPSAIELELTESLLVADAHHVSDVLQRLGAQGIKFAIDDFGTGYSNLGYLQRFAVHRLKIDQSFVRKLSDSPLEDGIVRAVIEMAHCLKLEVVAEGVENEATLQSLKGFGCEFAQGYHWAPALPEAAFEAFVRTRNELPPA
jgi:diguanylate cyclase (GGDEF)-like protein